MGNTKEQTITFQVPDALRQSLDKFIKKHNLKNSLHKLTKREVLGTALKEYLERGEK